MIVSTVKKTMKKALNTFALLENETPENISVVIHTKSDEFIPEYFYLVNNVPKRDDEGNIKSVTFADMLGKKFDLLNRELIASQFLRGWFATQQKTMNTSAKDLYIVIGTLDKQIEKLHIELSNKGKKEKDLKLEEIFLEDQ